MTEVGHILTGATIGVACMPEQKPLRWRFVYFLIFILLAVIPDIKIKYWGHDRYYISHSLFTNVLAMFGVILFLSRRKGLIDELGGRMIVVGGGLAWLSHLFLDTFYNHGKGLAMFWPISEARLALPIAWFSVVKNIPPPMTWETARILLIEFVCYGALLLIVIFLKRSGVIQRIIKKPPNPA
jgi:hypothetical protein